MAISSLWFLSETSQNPTVFDSGSCPQLVPPQNTAYFGQRLRAQGRDKSRVGQELCAIGAGARAIFRRKMKGLHHSKQLGQAALSRFDERHAWLISL